MTHLESIDTRRSLLSSVSRDTLWRTRKHQESHFYYQISLKQMLFSLWIKIYLLTDGPGGPAGPTSPSFPGGPCQVKELVSIHSFTG